MKKSFIDRVEFSKELMNSPQKHHHHTYKVETFLYSGVKRINNVYANVNKVENVCVYLYIFSHINNGVYVVYALYSSILDIIM